MSSTELYVVMGVSGRTGSSVARYLLRSGKRVRAVVRDAAKANIWASQGAEVAIACLTDEAALINALSGADGAYVVSPQQYTVNNLFEQAELIASTIAEASAKAQLPKLVALSSIGADRSSGTGWIAMNRMLEQYLSKVELPVTFLRAAYFMENWSPMIKAAEEEGVLSSFLAPLDRKLPMIATDDVGRIAAEALCEEWHETRIIELQGPAEYSPKDIANSLTQVFNKAVNASVISTSDWGNALAGSGMSEAAIEGFIEMTQALNSGYIVFTDDTNIDHRQGNIALNTIIESMAAHSNS